jgi:hypothetical protein
LGQAPPRAQMWELRLALLPVALGWPQAFRKR